MKKNWSVERHCVVVILSGVTLDAFQSFDLHQEGFLGLGVDVWIVSMKKESEDKMRVHVFDKIMITKKQRKNDKDIWEWHGAKVNDLTEGLVNL